MSDEYDPILDDLRLICGRPMCYDRDGQPITLRQWAELREDVSNIIVAKTVVKAGEVSTVWRGLDHAFFSEPPLIFETMIFELELRHGPFGPYHESLGERWRYSTEEEALRGHLAVVEAHGGPVVS